MSAWFGKHLNQCPSTPPPGFQCSTCRWFAYGGDTAPGGKPGGYVDSAFFDYTGGVAAPVDEYHLRAGIYQVGIVSSKDALTRAYQVPYLISPRWFCKWPGEFYLGRICWLQRKYCGQQIDRMDKDSGVSTGTLYDTSLVDDLTSAEQLL